MEKNHKHKWFQIMGTASDAKHCIQYDISLYYFLLFHSSYMLNLLKVLIDTLPSSGYTEIFQFLLTTQSLIIKLQEV